MLGIHDAAHAQGDSDLHALAVGLMASVGVEHISTDDLDNAPTEDAFAGLPTVVPVGSRAVCVTPGGGLIVDEVLSSALPLSDLPIDLCDGDLAGECSPVYDLCLLRRDRAEPFTVDGVLPGAQVVVPTPQDSGTFRLPAVAHPWEGELVQVHKHDGAAEAFDATGTPVDCDLSTYMGSDAENGVWLATIADGRPVSFDALVVGHRQTHALPMEDRQLWIDEAFAAPATVIDDKDKLWGLSRGRWLIRWLDDGFDAGREHWFRLDAQQVRPGQYVRPVSSSDEDIDGPLVACRLMGGLRAQLHRDGDRVWVFRDGGAVDIARLFPAVTEAAKELPKDAYVLCGELTGELSSSQLRRAMSRGKSIEDADVVFNAFDCLYVGREDIHDSPCHRRARLMRGFVAEAGVVKTAEFCDPEKTPRTLLRSRNGQYPMDGGSLGWYEVPAPPTPEDAISTLDAVRVQSENERRLSRLWVERDGALIEQMDVAVPFVYHRRFDGIMSVADASAALNSILSGDVPEGIHTLTRPVEEVRVEYRDTDWSKARRVVTKALESAEGAVDLSALVVRASVSGELRIQAPSQDWLLGVEQAVVNEALQFLVRPEELEEIGADSFAETSDYTKWASEQMEPQDSSWLDPMRQEREWDEGSMLLRVDRGSAILGVQKHDFHEAFLVFEGDIARSGRYTWSLVDIAGRGLWLGTMPKDQTPYIIRHDRDEEAEKARKDNGWIAWNPEGIRVLAETPLANMLPVNWEERIDPFEDTPFVDFPS